MPRLTSSLALAATVALLAAPAASAYGPLREKVGTQHLIDETDLEHVLADDEDHLLPAPPHLRRMADGRSQPNWVRLVREGREGR